MFRLPILQLRLNCFYPNLSKCETRVNNMQLLETTLVHEQAINNKCKVQRIREERCKHKITWQCVIKDEIEELGEKLLCDPPSQNRSTSE